MPYYHDLNYFVQEKEIENIHQLNQLVAGQDHTNIVVPINTRNAGLGVVLTHDYIVYSCLSVITFSFNVTTGQAPPTSSIYQKALGTSLETSPS